MIPYLLRKLGVGSLCIDHAIAFKNANPALRSANGYFH
jgi:hypothetical protein